MSRCVVVAAGPYSDAAKLSRLVSSDDLVIAADAGWQLAKDMKLQPKKLVADFDSMPIPDLPKCVEVVQLPAKKDDTDTAVAMRQGYEDGCRSFLLLGCTGGRLDHYYATLTVAAQYAVKGCEVVIADEQNVIRVLTAGQYAFPSTPGDTVSMFAFGGDVTNLSFDGLEYEKSQFRLSPLNPLCVSNTSLEDVFRVSFGSGILLLHFSKD